MDFLNKAWAQLTDLFRSMTVGARITTGLLLVVVAVSLVYLLRFHTSGADLYLMEGDVFTPAELDAMEAAFSSASLQSYRRENNRIRVPRGQQAAYMAALAEKNALPRNPFRYLEAAMSAQSSLFDTSKHWEQRYNVALQRVLSDTIRWMPRIEDAQVLFSSQKASGFGKETLTTALVSVKPQGNSQLDQSRVNAIRQALTGAIAGLKPQDVKVFDANSGRTFYGDPESGGNDDLLMARTRTEEEHYQKKILDQLSNIKGVLVSVTVQLDPMKSQRTRESKIDPKPVALESIEKSKTRTLEGTVPAARAGYSANQPAALPAALGKGSKEEEDEVVRQERSAVGKRDTESEYWGSTVKSARVAVGIPMSHFEKIWRKDNPTPPGETSKTPQPADLEPIRKAEIAKARETVEKLIPLPDGAADASKLVDVHDYSDIPEDPLPEPRMQQRAVEWLGRHWSTLGLGFLVLISLLMLRSMVRAAPGLPPRAPQATSAAAVAGQEEETRKKEEVPAQRRLRRLTGTGTTLRDELSDLVSEDPDAAANILRTWIGNVS